MRAGALIGNGNNTCVYNPPVECADGTAIPAGHISRIVPADSIEPDVQTRIKAAFRNMDPQYLKHFNLATKICRAKFKASDLANPCPVASLWGAVQVGSSDLINMLTPVQESDINTKETLALYKDLETTNAGFRDFLHAIVEMNSESVQVFHSDSHIGNVSWKGTTIVLHDWEKSMIGDARLLADINGSTPDSWRLLGFRPDSQQRAYLNDFPCWKYPLLAMTIFDGYYRPFEHMHLRFTHRVFFRFWDLLALGVSLRQMYHFANVEEPVYIKKIMSTAMDYFFDSFRTSLGNEPSAVEAKVKLNEITAGIHKIIDAGFDDSNSDRAAGELLRLVAFHSKNSPSKGVLLNMLPKVTGGGWRRRCSIRVKRKKGARTYRLKRV